MTFTEKVFESSTIFICKTEISEGLQYHTFSFFLGWLRTSIAHSVVLSPMEQNGLGSTLGTANSAYELHITREMGAEDGCATLSNPSSRGLARTAA